MRMRSGLFIFIFVLSTSFLCFGQEAEWPYEDDNWLSVFRGVYSGGYGKIIYRYDNYTPEDVAKAKQKLHSIGQTTADNEWEGIYVESYMPVGDMMMIWDAENGFFSFYHYHELRYLDYGQVENSPDSIRLISKKNSKSGKQTNNSAGRLIKVKYGETHFLVFENHVKNFLEVAAGLDVQTSGISDNHYWTKQTDYEKEVFGTPVVPAGYRHLLHYPIKAEIIEVGKKKIIPNEQSTQKYNFDDIHYPVTLNVGTDKTVKPGMNFFVADLNEWITIEKVFEKKSVGFFRRDFDSDGREVCWDDRGGNGLITECREIKSGMKAVTKTYL